MSTNSAAMIEHDGLVSGPDDFTDDEIETPSYVRPTVRPFRPTDGFGGPPIVPGHPKWEPIRKYLEQQATPQNPFQERADDIARLNEAINTSARDAIQETIFHLIDQGEESLHRVLGADAPKLRGLKAYKPGTGGRKKLEEESWPHWREQADKAIKLRAQGYTWPDLKRRMKTPTRTLQRWVQHRQDEAENS